MFAVYFPTVNGERMYRVYLYATATGNSPVRDFLDDLPEKQAAKVVAAVDYLGHMGPALQRPHAAHLRGKLWELRVSWARLEYRVLYAFLAQKNIVLLHAFAKKSDAVPAREIRTAEVRLGDFENRVRSGEVTL
jgi:phage-related protein